MSTAPMIMIAVPSNFFRIFRSLKNAYPSPTETIPDNWNNASA